jgi:hypothetical protein
MREACLGSDSLATIKACQGTRLKHVGFRIVVRPDWFPELGTFAEMLGHITRHEQNEHTTIRGFSSPDVAGLVVIPLD